jgi:hypothetical protein
VALDCFAEPVIERAFARPTCNDVEKLTETSRLDMEVLLWARGCFTKPIIAPILRKARRERRIDDRELDRLRGVIFAPKARAAASIPSPRAGPAADRTPSCTSVPYIFPMKLAVLRSRIFMRSWR